GTSLTGFFDNNIIGAAGETNSGSGYNGGNSNGIMISAGSAGIMSLTITNNQIHQVHGNAYIWADNTGGSYTVNLDIEHNTFDTPGAGVFAGAAITNDAPHDPAATDDTINVCAVVGGSTAAQKNTFSLGAGVYTS